MALVRDGQAMIAGMAPDLVPGDIVFVSVSAETARAHLDAARALVRENEGVTLVLPSDHAAAPRGASTFRQITLNVHSALDGVGLTAAVAEALAAAEIPCNVIAGFHHDHIFVPAAQANKALNVLVERARRAQREE